ncbi:MAG: hypothetical protein ABL864_09325 [Terricaulis sp.]
MSRVGSGLVALGLLLTGCNVTPQPSFWAEACRNETGVRVYEALESAPLAMTHALDADEALLNIGASAAEFYVSGVGGERAELYREGRGRYLVTWSAERSQACDEALEQAGFDPTTLDRRHAVEPYLSRFNLDRCYVAQRLGGFPPSATPDSTLEEEYAAYSAPYVLRMAGELDPRSRDVKVHRSTWQIVRRADGVVVGESIGFSYRTNLILDVGIAICGGGGGPVGQTVFDERVFGRAADELNPRPN